MAQYKDTLELIDKVTSPLKRINKAINEQQTCFDKLKAKIDASSGALVKNISENKRLATAMKTIKQVGGGVATVANGVKNVALGVGAVYGAVSAAAAGTLAVANKAAEAGDRIDKMSQKIGMSRQAFQEWDYIMSQNGGDVESLQMGFKTLTNQIAGVQKGSKDSVKAFSDLGVSIKDSSGNFRTQEDVFNDSIRALQKIQDPTKKAMLANQLFGRSAAELKPLLNQEAGAIDDLRAKANKNGLILSDEEIDNAVKYKDTMDTLQRVMGAKFQSSMMAAMPALTGMLEEITELIPDVTKELASFFKENESSFTPILEGVKWIITTAIPATIKGVLTATNVIAKAFRTVGAIIGAIIGTIITIPDNISIVFSKMRTSIIIAFVNLKKQLIGVFQQVQQTIISIIQKIMDSIKGIISAVNVIEKIRNRRGSGNSSNTNNTTTNNSSVVNNYNNTYNNGNTYNSLVNPLSGLNNALVPAL